MKPDATNMSRSCPPTRLFLAALLLVGGFRSLRADELRLNAKTLIERSVASDVELTADGSAIVLESGELFEDDGPGAGYSYQPNQEKLTPGIWIKKELMIADPQTSKATLLVGSGGTLQAIINGQPTELVRDGKAGNYWEKYSFSPSVLRPGKNEIVLHGTGSVWIARADEYAAGSTDRTEPPNRSARSTDGGKTWSYDQLGNAGSVDGEYYVRVFLDHYLPKGSLTLPVLDAGNLAGQPIAPPIGAVGPIRIQAIAETGDNRMTVVRARTGPAAVPDKSWSDWTKVEGDGTIAKPAGRYVQVEIGFETRNPLQSPRLKEVVIEAIPTRTGDWTGKLRVLGSHNEEIVRSSIPFQYEPFDHPKLKTLREQYNLDKIVGDATKDLEIASRLTTWSSQQWSKGHLSESYPPWDALEILKPHPDGGCRGGFCQQYNLVFLQACESFGLVGRPVSLGPAGTGHKIRGGHEVVEIWSNEHRKWIYIDGQAAWSYSDSSKKTPLSLLELRDRQLEALLRGGTTPIEPVVLAETRHQWGGLLSFPPYMELRLIPRSNFLSADRPVPLHQGMRGWFWTGHHVWTDADLPAALLYGNRVTQRRNWEWTINQARYTLEPLDRPGELRVHLDTVTPGFDTFVASIDQQAVKPVESGFVWKLHAGKNRLEVRPRNSAGRDGIASWIELELP